MPCLRFRTQLLIATLLIICALTASLLYLVRRTVRSQIEKQAKESTDTWLHGFKAVQQQRELELSRTAAMLAELPTLKALMTTEHALTIQNASEPFWRLADSDLFLLADSEGQILGFHVKTPGWVPQLVEPDLKRSTEERAGAAWWYAGGQLYWVFLHPIDAGAGNDRKQLGILVVGNQVNNKVAEQLAFVPGSLIAIVTNDKVIASTLPFGAKRELQLWIGQQNSQVDARPREMSLRTGQYQVASFLIHNGLPTPVRCYVLMSLEPITSFIRRINHTIFILGTSAVVLAALLLSLVSRTITLPLENLVAAVRALAIGDYTYTISSRGSSEVAELASAFSKMRRELSANQQRWIATERIAALGRAAASISHDLRHHLAAVVANAEFLYEADKLRLDKHEVYSEIKTASEQITDLLDSLRELAREDSVISPVHASLDQTVRRAVEVVLTRPEFRSRVVSIRSSGDMAGVFDPRQLERAFFNLVLNACEATSLQGRINIEIQSSTDSFQVRIADNGPGIPASIRATLFTPFVSAGKLNGTGLGLAIVNKIVRDHAGTVTVEQTSDLGTVLLVRLPRASYSVSLNTQTAVT